MCGICGFITTTPFDHRQALSAMSNRLKHRGPDADGDFIDERHGVYLAHRRLSVIDLSAAGNQPLGNEDQTIHVIVNGEFYNFQELRSQLLSHGHVFRSHSDSEVLVHGYEQWGDDVFRRLEGIYAAVLWDGRQGLLYLARDPLGVKPLVYMENSRGLFFSSEAQAFHALPKMIFYPRFDDEALHQLVCFQYIYEPQRTAYQGVKRVRPGTWMVYQEGKLREKTFWRLSHQDLPAASDPELIEEVEDKLRKAVHSQMVADVPVGILLSGGLDSSVVAALAQETRTDPIWTFTAGFEHSLDERPYARQVAEHIGSRHHEFLIDPGQINRRLDDLVPKLDDLTSLDGGMFTTHLISEKILDYGVKVLLVGEGSDEIFGGYSWFGLSRFPFNLTGSLVRSALFYYCISRMLPIPFNYPDYRRIHRIMQEEGFSDIFQTIGAFEITRQLPNHFLMKVDHGTMSLGIEARVPFLDRDLVETVFNLPGELKLTGKTFSFKEGREKYALRELARKILPESIAVRKKRGFSIPMPEVLQNNYEKMHDLLLSDGSVARRFFSRSAVERLMTFKATMYSPLHKHREFLCWRLLLIEIWRKHYGVTS